VLIPSDVPVVHGISSSYFGDDEWDVGASVRWLQYFCTTQFALDSNVASRPRSYFIAWDKVYPDAKYAYFSAHDFFDGISAAAAWRRDSFEKADAAWGYDADDWVLFVDCTEGLCVDTGNPPPQLTPDPDAYPLPTTGNLPPIDIRSDPFKSYVAQEIDNAGSSGRIYLPFWAFTRHSAPYMVYRTIDPNLESIISTLPPDGSYQGLTVEELRRANISAQAAMYSYYTTPGFLPRLFRVSVLRDPNFDWESLDRFVGTVPGIYGQSQISLSLISYAYARWTPTRTMVNLTTGYPATEQADVGFSMRQRMSQVRPITGLPHTLWPPVDTPSEFAADLAPSLEPQPGASRLNAEGAHFSAAFADQTLNFRRRAVTTPTAAWPSRPMLSTPLYPTVLRGHLREGLFFLDRELGPVPWNFVTHQAAVDQDRWDVKNFTPVSQSRP
jgi:hypothetical protein